MMENLECFVNKSGLVLVSNLLWILIFFLVSQASSLEIKFWGTYMLWLSAGNTTLKPAPSLPGLFQCCSYSWEESSAAYFVMRGCYRGQVIYQKNPLKLAFFFFFFFSVAKISTVFVNLLLSYLTMWKLNSLSVNFCFFKHKSCPENKGN